LKRNFERKRSIWKNWVWR